MATVNKEKQRLLKINVEEVSVVDSPAIEEEFVIIKRLQEDKMADKKVEKKTEGIEEDKIEKVEVEVPDAVEAVMKKVSELMDDVKKASKEEVEKEEDTEATPKEKVETLPKEEAPAKEEEKKEEEEDVEKKQDDILKSIEECISKARRFTPQREEQLKTSINSLQTLLEDISPESPEAEETSVEKKKGEDKYSKLLKGLETMIDSFTEINKRVETIEKRRQPTTSVEEDSTTDKTNEKVEKNLWSGVL